MNVGAGAHCQVPGCDWKQFWDTKDGAGCAATWHVYEHHPRIWQHMFGDNPPRDPRPEGTRLA